MCGQRLEGANVSLFSSTQRLSAYGINTTMRWLGKA